MVCLHSGANDAVRTLGAAERLRLVGKSQPAASSPDEQASCAVQMAMCLYSLRWEDRRDEARDLLSEVLSDERVTVEGREQLERLAQDEWFRG